MRQFGTKRGRLMYRTAAEARAVADELGITGIHSHMMDMGRIFMPGNTHDELNDALRAMGRQPTMMPGQGGMGMGGGMDQGMSTDMGGGMDQGMDMMMGNASNMDDRAMDVFAEVEDAEMDIPSPTEMPSVDVPETEDMFGDLFGPDRGTDDDDDMRIY